MPNIHRVNRKKRTGRNDLAYASHRRVGRKIEDPSRREVY